MGSAIATRSKYASYASGVLVNLHIYSKKKNKNKKKEIMYII